MAVDDQASCFERLGALSPSTGYDQQRMPRTTRREPQADRTPFL